MKTKKIKLFIDFRCVSDKHPTGVAKHAYFVAKGLAADSRFSLSTLVTRDQIGHQGCLDFLSATEVGISWRLAREMWTWTNLPNTDRWVGDTDWVYCLKNDWVPVNKARYAVTIHGAHELDPNFCRPNGLREKYNCARNRKQYQRMCDRADVVFTVSDWLKQFIVDQFHADAGKIFVVGNGVDAVFFEAGKRKKNLMIDNQFQCVPLGGSSRISVVSQLDTKCINTCQKVVPYILCVGGLNYIDGGDGVIALGNEIKRSGVKIRIKVAGVQHDSGAENLALETGVIDLLGYVPHERLAEIMANALVLYYPTRYETFGMAAAEAMAACTLVIANNSTAVPEIVGDYGIYVDPKRPKDVLKLICGIEEDITAYADLINRANKHVERYSWDACVGRISDVLLARS